MKLSESVDRVLAKGTALPDRFYELFFVRHPEAKALFAHTHMSAQSVMLSVALMVAKHHPDYPMAAEQYLNVLGTRHSRKHVPRDLYPAFQETLLDALEEFHGEDWSDGLATQWREALDSAVRRMFEGYDRPAHV